MPVIERRYVAIVLGLLALMTSIDAAESRHKWWQSEKVQQEIGLSPAQVKALEAVFQDALPAMREEKADLDLKEKALSRLLREAAADETEVMMTIDRVEMARARASKVRLLMIYRMYRVLSPLQLQTLKAMQERSKSDRRGGSK